MEKGDTLVRLGEGLILEQARRRASSAVKWRQVHWAMEDEKSKLRLGLKGERAQLAYVPRHKIVNRDTVWRLGFGVDQTKT